MVFILGMNYIQDIEDLVKLDSTFEVLKDPIQYDLLETVIQELVESIDNKSNREIRDISLSLMRKYKSKIVKNSQLAFIYRKMVKQGKINSNINLEKALVKNPSRNISGIVCLTVLTAPFPDGQKFSCEHNCYYCPNEPGQPRSYLKKEPAVARANDNNFDASEQIISRLNSLCMNGHTLDKLEIIIEGGTFTEYPKSYLKNFIRDMIYTINTYWDKYKRDKLSIHEEIFLNANAKMKIIGICSETRPDCIVKEGHIWLPLFRQWGITRVQIGVQHIDNKILKLINRGHKVEDSIQAIRILKNNAFKVDIHVMPDLPGSNPEKDIDMLNQIFYSENFSPDQIKIYPCQVVPWTIIEKWNKEGVYIPYADSNFDGFCDVIEYALTNCPPYQRLPRVVRDIPNNYISAGNQVTNLRQIIQQRMDKKKISSYEIRNRECGRHPEYKEADAELVVRKYNGSEGLDYFISYESPDRAVLFGFLRLRIPYKNHKTYHKDIYISSNDTYGFTNIFPELNGSALIREIHVYGEVVAVGSKNPNAAQHSGFGKKMIRKAEEIAMSHRRIYKISVISGIGVVNYYHNLGYKQDGHYLSKKIEVYKNGKAFKLLILSFTYVIPLISLLYYLFSTREDNKYRTLR